MRPLEGRMAITREGKPTMNTNTERRTFAPESTQDYGEDPHAVRDTESYQKEYVRGFVEKWDECA